MRITTHFYCVCYVLKSQYLRDTNRKYTKPNKEKNRLSTIDQIAIQEDQEAEAIIYQRKCFFGLLSTLKSIFQAVEIQKSYQVEDVYTQANVEVAVLEIVLYVEFGPPPKKRISNY